MTTDGPADSARFLVEAAAELFTQRGFERTSLQAVADRAGVAKGLVAHHFGSKDGLLEAVLLAFYRRQREVLDAAHDPSLPDRDRVAAVVDAYFDFMCESHLYPRLIQHLAGRDERVRQLSQEQLRGLHDWVETEVLAALDAEGAAAARQFAITFAGAVLTYFSFAPALEPRWPGGGLLSVEALDERRAHLHLLIGAPWAHLDLPERE